MWGCPHSAAAVQPETPNGARVPHQAATASALHDADEKVRQSVPLLWRACTRWDCVVGHGLLSSLTCIRLNAIIFVVYQSTLVSLEGMGVCKGSRPLWPMRHQEKREREPGPGGHGCGHVAV